MAEMVHVGGRASLIMWAQKVHKEFLQHPVRSYKRASVSAAVTSLRTFEQFESVKSKHELYLSHVQYLIALFWTNTNADNMLWLVLGKLLKISN